MLAILSLLYLVLNRVNDMGMYVKFSTKLHSLARAGGAEDHLVAVLGLLPQQPRQAGLRDLLRGNIAAASESPTAAASAENIAEGEATQEAACENVNKLKTGTWWVKHLPALARMATPAMAVTWAAVKTIGAAPAAAMVRPKVASVPGIRVTIIRREAIPRVTRGRIYDIFLLKVNMYKSPII